MAVVPLIDPLSVYQNALGVAETELPLAQRTLVGTKATVVKVYPVGHQDNPSGQTLVDLLPTSGLPPLLRVPLAHGHAHEETEEQAPLSERRNHAAPRDRYRMEGDTADVRHGTFVWVSFLNGSIHDPVVTATLGFNQKTAAEAPRYKQLVDRIDDDGNLVATPQAPLDATMDGDYPRRVRSYNGVRDEIDNRGNRYIQTSREREPLFKGHNGIPKSDDPEGNFGVSTRGARIGHLGFTTGKDPQTDQASKGRQFRRTIGADDGTIRDSTNSSVGHIIRRIRAGIGRMWESAAGGSDGRWYAESRGRSYVALNSDGAEVRGAGKVVLDGDTIYLGSGEAGSEITLHPQLMAMFQALVTIFDTHTHSGVTVGQSNTAVPNQLQTSTFSSQKDNSKASGVKADQTNAPSPSPQDDPED